MTVRFPLIVNSTTGQIGELPSGDDLSVTGGNLITNGSVIAGTLITTAGVFWPNGAPVVAYTNSNVATYLAYGNDATVNSILTNLNILASEIYANSNVAVYLSSDTDPTIVSLKGGLQAANGAIAVLDTLVYNNSNVANYLPSDATIQRIQADILGANASIMNMYAITSAYVNSVTTAWTANATLQETEIAGIQSNLYVVTNTVNQNQQSIANLQLGQTAANVSIAANAANISVLQSELFGATANIELNTGYIAFLENSASYTNAQISTLANTVSQSSLDIGNLQASAYGNANVAAYLPFDYTIQTLVGNIELVNAAIVASEVVMKNYVDSVTTAWTANALLQESEITTINANLVALTGVAANNTTAISAIDTSVANVAANVDLNTTQITSIVSNVGILQTNVATLSAVYTSLDLSLTGAISTVTNSLLAINSTISTNGNITSNLLVNVDALTSTVGNVVANVELLQVELANVSDLVSNLSTPSNLDVISNTLANIQTSVTTLDANVGSISANVDVLMVDYPVFDANLGTVAIVIANIGTVLSATGNAVANLQSNTGNLATQINNLDGNIGQIVVSLSGAESSITTLTQGMFTVTGSVSTLQTEMSATISNVTTLQTELAANTNVAAFTVIDNGSNTLIPSNVWTKVLFDTVLADATSAFSNSSFVPGHAGYYQLNYIFGANTFGANSGTLTSSIYVNGNTYLGAGKTSITSNDTWQNASFVVKLNATDVVEIYAMQTSTSNISADTGISFSGSFVRSS
jgi:hypothetical protein